MTEYGFLSYAVLSPCFFCYSEPISYAICPQLGMRNAGGHCPLSYARMPSTSSCFCPRVLQAQLLACEPSQ
ncbi:unnamed protein product [Spirodela intermedia]|uniref:Uncharacterized protein n=1 Tax=Spirodela intermedia TaxID=51605 RepID=A0A7I8K3D7_SPIIN|nr:unnamed protein product [Spirodela intermedia]